MASARQFMAARTAAWAKSGGGGTNVEYIEGTGTQWFDTEYLGGDGTGFEIDFKLTEVQSEKGIFGCLSLPRIAVILAGYSYRNDIGYGSTYKYDDRSITRRTITYDASSGSVHDSVYGLVGWDDHYAPITEQCLDTLTVFVDKRDGTIVSQTRITKMRLYSLKIFQYGELVMDIVPMSDGNVGYAFDKISGKKFYSQSGDDFIAGPTI